MIKPGNKKQPAVDEEFLSRLNFGIKMKMVFLNLQSELSLLGLLNVIRHLEKNGYLCKHVYLVKSQAETDQEIGSILSFIEREKPALIGFSLMTFNFFRAKELTVEIKKRFPEIPILWGGIHPTFAPDESIQYADYVCIGEGEDAALELIRAIETGLIRGNIPNLWMKRNGQVIKNDPRPLIQNLDDYSFPKINWENTYCLHDGKIVLLKPEL